MSSWPKMIKEENSGKCQSIYWNLVCALEARGDIGVLTIKELRHTARCDHIQDLSGVRNAVEVEMTANSLKNILSSSYSDVDVVNANAALFHYHEYAKIQIYYGLSPVNKAYYHTIFHWDKWAAGGTGIFAGLGGLYKVAKLAGRLGPGKGTI